MDEDTVASGAGGSAPPSAEYTNLTGEWLGKISEAERTSEKWMRRGEKIVKRYREDDDSGGGRGSRFNIFWSNVQTLAPATYSRRPKVEVSRRFRDADPVARLAGQILERALQYEIDCRDDFHQTMQAVVLDRLLPGRGVAWVRYEPAFRQESTQNVDELGNVVEQEVEVLADERTPVDYVYWKDFLTSPARTWADVEWIARRVMFHKDHLHQRFGETTTQFGGNLAKVNFAYEGPDQDSKVQSAEPSKMDSRRALVWEIWDKTNKRLIWVSKGYDFPLDVREDVLEIDDFWPIPRPLTATTTNDKLLPVADYVIYQEQVRELDSLSIRISALQRALRVVGVYDATQQSLKDILSSDTENQMIPVPSWAAFAEKGGLKSSVDFLPLATVVQVLQGLYDARDRTKQLVYEITGMADIVRGATVASETLGAQQIKARFANLRLSSRQGQVAEFVTAVLRIKAEIMCQQYSPETLIRIASAEQIKEAMDDPSRIEPAIALLKDEKTRQYRIEVMASSLVEADEVEERGKRNDFMSVVSNFMNGAKNISAGVPEMMPVVLEMLKFVVRGYPVGRGLESTIETASEAIMAKLANPELPQPDPTEVLRLQADEAKQEAETRRELMRSMTKSEVANTQAEASLAGKAMAAEVAVLAAARRAQ